MRSSASQSQQHFDEKEQLTWLPSLKLPVPPARPASALPATRSVRVVNVGGDSTSHAPQRDGEEADSADSHAATAWRCMSDRRPHTASAITATATAAATSAASSSSAWRAPFNTSAARFARKSTKRSAPPASQSTPAAAAQSTPAPSASSPPVALLSSPSFSRKGYGVGFVSANARFPRSRCSRPSPASYHTAQRQEQSSRQHASLASAAFYSANHDGHHLPPQPSQPRVAPTTAAVGDAVVAQSPPSVPFVSAYFLRRPNPAPTAYYQHPPAQSLKAASIGTAARQAPFGEQRGAMAEPTPSAASYDPLWQATRPSSSNAASVHFTSLTQRMQQQQAASALAHALQQQSADNPRAAAQPRPHSALPRHSERQQHPTSSFHPPHVSHAAGFAGRLSLGASGAASPSPAAYSVRLASSRPHAPHHSFAPPAHQPPVEGVAALRVTRGGPGLANNLTSAGRAAERERWTLHCHPATGETAHTERPASSSRTWSASAGLSVSDAPALTGHHSFHFNHKHVWV